MHHLKYSKLNHLLDISMPKTTDIKILGLNIKSFRGSLSATSIFLFMFNDSFG